VRLRLLFAVAVVLAAGISVPAAVAAAPAGGVGIRLLSVPGPASSNPLARSAIVATLAPGATLSRRVEIGNSTSQPVNVAVYAAAAFLREGVFATAAGQSRNAAAAWITLSQPTLELQPGEKRFVAVTVRVPADATAGEHYAALWAQLAATTSNGIKLVNRVGVRLYLTVGPGGTAPANFRVGALHSGRSAAGVPFVSATVANDGTRTLLITAELSLTDGPGGIRGPLPVKIVQSLSPRATVQVRVPLARRLPAGPWRALLRVQSGVLVRTAAATLNFPAVRPVATPVVAPSAAAAKPPVTQRQLLAGIILLTLLLAAAVIALAVSGARPHPQSAAQLERE
jgi:hypothetical protein